MKQNSDKFDTTPTRSTESWEEVFTALDDADLLEVFPDERAQGVAEVRTELDFCDSVESCFSEAVEIFRDGSPKGLSDPAHE